MKIIISESQYGKLMEQSNITVTYQDFEKNPVSFLKKAGCKPYVKIPKEIIDSQLENLSSNAVKRIADVCIDKVNQIDVGDKKPIDINRYSNIILSSLEKVKPQIKDTIKEFAYFSYGISNTISQEKFFSLFQQLFNILKPIIKKEIKDRTSSVERFGYNMLGNKKVDENMKSFSFDFVDDIISEIELMGGPINWSSNEMCKNISITTDKGLNKVKPWNPKIPEYSTDKNMTDYYKKTYSSLVNNLSNAAVKISKDLI